MKKKFMTKALAVVLSASMAFSMSSAVNMETASAAAKVVRLNTTYKTLKVGQKDYKLKLVNNSLKWKIKKASTTNKKIATVYGKKASYVLLKGKGVGRATIRLSLKTSARKKNNTKTLKCRVNVVPAASTPGGTDPGTQPVVQTSAVVGTQTELDAALANPVLTEITIRTDNTASFVIPAGTHSTVDLTIDAPNASVTNSGVFKSVTIADISDNAWTEKAEGNTFKVSALKARVVIEEGARAAGVAVTKADADVTIETKGTLAGVTISAKAKVTLTGTAAASLIPVRIEAAAAGAEFISSVPVAVETAADATIELQENAEKSTVDITDSNAVVTIKNNTKNYAVPVTRGTSKRTVSRGTQTLRPSTSTAQGGSTGSWGGSSGAWGGGSGGSYYPTDNRTENAKVAYNETDLAKWLKDSSVTKITIMHSEEGWTDSQITIPENTYNMDLVVDAPSETLYNYGKFNSVTVKNISMSTWYERARGNKITVSAPKPHIVVDETASIDKIAFENPAGKTAIDRIKLEVKGSIANGIQFASTVKNADVDVVKGASVFGGIGLQRYAKDSNIKLNVSGRVNGAVNCIAEAANLIVTVQDESASVADITVLSKMNVMIKATVENIAKNIGVILRSEGAKLTSAVPVNITADRNDAVVVLEKGAEGSKLTYGSSVDAVGISTEVDITATKQGSSETAKIPEGTKASVSIDGDKISAESVDATGIELNYADVTIVEGDSEDLAVSLVPAYADDKIIDSKWTPSAEGFADITKDAEDPTAAKLSALSVGQTKLTVSVTLESGRTIPATDIMINVMAKENADTTAPTITVDKETAEIAVGETVKLTADVTPDDAEVKWSSSDETVAAVEASGKTATVTGKGNGEAKITASVTVDGKTATATSVITVKETAVTPETPSIKVAPETADVAVGGTVKLTATVTPSDAKVVWVSDKTGVATVTGSALEPTATVTGVDAGTANITATITVDGKEYTAKSVITVKSSGTGGDPTTPEDPSETEKPTITLSTPENVKQVGVGEKLTVTAVVTEGNAVRWESSDESIATVNNGEVTGVKAGVVTITATVTDANDSTKTNSANITINVVAAGTPTVKVASVTVTGSSLVEKPTVVVTPTAFEIKSTDIKATVGGKDATVVIQKVQVGDTEKTAVEGVYTFEIAETEVTCTLEITDESGTKKVYTVTVTVTITEGGSTGYTASASAVVGNAEGSTTP